MPRNPFEHVEFLLGAARWSQFPADVGAEVAFAGRSNAGKSSAVNTITARKALARTSKTPGRTREINFFTLGDTCRLVDLPGYGYAKVPRRMQAEWLALIESYLAERGSLRGLVVVMDIRRPFTELDCQLVEWCQSSRVAVHVLLSKADKLSRGKAAATLLQATRRARSLHSLISLQVFSSHDRTGVEEAGAWIVSALGRASNLSA